jgi:hypothetical protein
MRVALLLDPAAVEQEAVVAPITSIAGYLQEQLGQQLAAYLSGLRDPKMTGRWAAGKVEPRDAAKLRLRSAFQATRMIVDAYDADIAKAWFVGSNTRLDDEAPAWVLRHGSTPDDIRLVVPAARAFAGAAG